MKITEFLGPDAVIAELGAKDKPGILRELAAPLARHMPVPADRIYAMLAERVNGWLGELTQETVGVVHGGVIRSLFHLIEGVPGQEAASLDTPQNLVLKLEDDRLTWL